MVAPFAREESAEETITCLTCNLFRRRACKACKLARRSLHDTFRIPNSYKVQSNFTVNQTLQDNRTTRNHEFISNKVVNVKNALASLYPHTDADEVERLISMWTSFNFIWLFSLSFVRAPTAFGSQVWHGSPSFISSLCNQTFWKPILVRLIKWLQVWNKGRDTCDLRLFCI